MVTFIDNKYTKIYFQLIEKRSQEVLNDGYYETHHIIPRSLNGSNSNDNLVRLTAREHYIAHKLLTKMTTSIDKRKMWWAFHRIIHSKNNFTLSSKVYEQFRTQWSTFASENHPSKTTDYWCNVVSESIRNSWIGANQRKEDFGDLMKANIKKWREDNPKEFSEKQRQSALASKMKNCEHIQYNGKTYIGWAELMRETGVDKFKYKKYYLNGIPLDFRKGVNGPMSINEIKTLIQYFFNNIDENFPSDECTLIKVLDRMVSVGLITKKNKELYLKG
jgi:hypothetical protein